MKNIEPIEKLLKKKDLNPNVRAELERKKKILEQNKVVKK